MEVRAPPKLLGEFAATASEAHAAEPAAATSQRGATIQTAPRSERAETARSRSPTPASTPGFFDGRLTPPGQLPTPILGRARALVGEAFSLHPALRPDGLTRPRPGPQEEQKHVLKRAALCAAPANVAVVQYGRYKCGMGVLGWALGLCGLAGVSAGSPKSFGVGKSQIVISSQAETGLLFCLSATFSQPASLVPL